MGSPVAILVATIVQFALGFVWYAVLFGKIWGKMHGFDKLSKEKQQQMQKEVMPLYGVQLLVTLLTSVVLSLFITNLPSDWNAYGMAFFFWLGFVLPPLTGATMFGGAPEGWIIKKLAIQAGYYLVSLQVAAFILKNLPI